MSRIAIVAAASAAAVLPLGGAYAAAPAAVTVTPNGTVALQGTPYLWVADANGVLHLATDTRSLADKPVDWSTRVTATADQLKSAPLGAPWLSTSLVKIGDAIYLPKWETGATAPTLLHIQTIDDLMLFGVNTADYGATVLPQQDWEQRFNFKVADLQKSELAPLAAPSAAPPPATTTATATTPAIAGSLSHLPVYGTDVSYTLPADRGWTDASTVEGLVNALPKLLVAGEQVIAQQRVLDVAGGPYVYLITSSVPLDQHPEIKTAADLASAASQQGTAMFVTASSTTTVAGIPATVQDVKLTRSYDPAIPASILADKPASDPPATTDQTDWYGHSVFVARGNYGYQFRLLSTDPSALNSRTTDLDRALATLTFGY